MGFFNVCVSLQAYYIFSVLQHLCYHLLSELLMDLQQQKHVKKWTIDIYSSALGSYYHTVICSLSLYMLYMTKQRNIIISAVNGPIPSALSVSDTTTVTSQCSIHMMRVAKCLKVAHESPFDSHVTLILEKLCRQTHIHSHTHTHIHTNILFDSLQKQFWKH